MEKQIKVIIVDDDPLSNFLCKENIKLVIQDQEVIDFVIAEEALDFVSGITLANNPNSKIYLFLDLNMPGMSGWEFLEKFRELPEQIKRMFEIYIISSSLDPNDEKRTQSFPYVKEYVIKPLSEKKLSAIFFEKGVC